MIDYIKADKNTHYNEAAILFREYAADINIDLGFQNFEEELGSLKTMYGPPSGGIILCRQDVRFVGCIAIRKIEGDICELKRMYVKPEFRNKGIGKHLLEKALSLAKKLRYKTIRLDTLNYMEPAIKLYEDYGFVRTEAYYFNPNSTAIFFEKAL